MESVCAELWTRAGLTLFRISSAGLAGDWAANFTPPLLSYCLPVQDNSDICLRAVYTIPTGRYTFIPSGDVLPCIPDSPPVVVSHGIVVDVPVITLLDNITTP